MIPRPARSVNRAMFPSIGAAREGSGRVNWGAHILDGTASRTVPSEWVSPAGGPSTARGLLNGESAPVHTPSIRGSVIMRRLDPHRLVAFIVVPASLCALAAAAAGTHVPSAPRLNVFLSDWRAAHGDSWNVRTDVQTGYLEMLSGGNVPSAVPPPVDAQFERLARTAAGSAI